MYEPRHEVHRALDDLDSFLGGSGVEVVGTVPAGWGAFLTG
ncbi:MAG TPA: hypothetical protein VIA02_09115 [Candidatus Limnocylindria bacterium]